MLLFAICFWILSVSYELVILTLVTTATQRKHSTCQLVPTETKGEKGLLSAISETGDKKEETFEFANLN